MVSSIGTYDFFSDAWDLSMSTVPEVAEENKNISYHSLFNEFKPCSPNSSFFGLPNHVKDLIFKYKGIDRLYGMYIFFKSFQLMLLP